MLRFIKIQSFNQKNFKIWYQKLLILVFLGSNLKKRLSCFKSVPSKTFGATIKILKFGVRGKLFEYFSIAVLKHYRHIWNRYSRIYQIAKFHLKRSKSLKLAPQIPCLGISRLKFEIKPLQYLTRSP